MFGDVKLAKTADPDKYAYNGYDIDFDSRLEFSLSDCSVGKNVISFGVNMSSSVHIYSKKKDLNSWYRSSTRIR